MTNKTITAFFDRYEDASEAVRRLEAAGISHGNISLIASNEGDRYSSHASRTFDGRLQLLEYVPTVLAGPPGTTKADA